MLKRKIEQPIREYLAHPTNKVLVIQGARQVGKSYIIRHVGQELYKNFIEVNLVEDRNGDGLFADVAKIEDFYLRLSMIAGNKMQGKKEDTLIFLDEIQEYPRLMTLLKFLVADNRFTFVASGSLLGVTLNSTVSIPVGSLRIMDMFPLDFEEFLWSQNFGQEAVDFIKSKLKSHESVEENIHTRLMDLFRKYLLIGGMPDAVNAYNESNNIQEVRAIQTDIMRLYAADAAKYDIEHRLKIQRVYQLIPSNMENKKKRVVVKDIEDKAGSRFSQYFEEFEYLIHSGIALEVMAVSDPRYPLAETMTKNLLKLYLNDVGLLTSVLYGDNPRAIIDDKCSVNLGSVYESAVAQQLRSNGHKLFYYDNKKKGEVDFLINDNRLLSVVPLEVKSGKDYTVHSAVGKLVDNEDYGILQGYVLSNDRIIRSDGKITYLPVYSSIIL